MRGLGWFGAALVAAGVGLACGGSSEKDEGSSGGSGGATGGTSSGGSGASSGGGSGGTSSGGSGGTSTGGSGGTSLGGAAGAAATGGVGAVGGGGAGGSGGKLTASECFKDIGNGTGPNYDQFDPTIGSHCKGTNHQDITGVEKVVYLGDSVTAGTPPTPADQFYRNQLTTKLQQKFGVIEVVDCSAWGARTDDFLIGQKQVEKCFPSGGDAKTTLVVFTIGGNDIAAWAKDKLTVDAATIEADKAADLLADAVKWLKDPARFPKGSFVAFANPYEYTDGTGDLFSCPAAVLGGLSGNWYEGAPAVIHFQERFMKIAVDNQADMIFTLEHFCGHGYKKDDPNGICYRGPNTEIWFDFTCTHPNPTGHGVIADMFDAVVEE